VFRVRIRVGAAVMFSLGLGFDFGVGYFVRLAHRI